MTGFPSAVSILSSMSIVGSAVQLRKIAWASGESTARAMRNTGGWAEAVSDESLVEGIQLLAETTGIFTETAGLYFLVEAAVRSGNDADIDGTRIIATKRPDLALFNGT